MNARLLAGLCLVLSGCDTAAVLMGGMGSGLTGGPNQGLAAVERRKDREAEAGRLEAQKCAVLLDANLQEQRMLNERHGFELESMKQETAMEVAAATSNAQKTAAYERCRRGWRNRVPRTRRA